MQVKLFGRMLLERALASDLNGKVTLDFAPEGLKCLMAFPLGGQQEKPGREAGREYRPGCPPGGRCGPGFG